MEFKDYYNVLGVARDADQDAIKRAYRRLARKYHPDVSTTDGYGSSGGHPVFRNNLPQDARNRSINVRVLDNNGRLNQQGAEVHIYDQNGRVLGSRLVSTGGGYNSQSAVPVHFGLRSSEPVTIKVTFVSSGRRVVTKTLVEPGPDVVDVRLCNNASVCPPECPDPQPQCNNASNGK